MQFDPMSGRFVKTFLGRETEFFYTVSSTYAVRLEFTVAGVPYTFDCTKWSGRGLKKFLPLFFEYEARDIDRFGSMEETDDGYTYHMTSQQKMNIVIRASEDVVETVNRIFDVHGRGLVDYCLWYRERFECTDSYARLVTRVACHNVVDAELLAPRVVWEMVTFPEKKRDCW